MAESDSLPALGAEIARWRRMRGIGLSTLASRSGLAKSTLSYWESGRRAPTGASLARVLDLLEVPERERARQALGPRFDLREYHHVVLENGYLPLWALEERVSRWIASKQDSPQ